MTVIITKRSGTRVVAKADGKGLRIPCDWEVSERDNHIAAARILAKRLNLSGTWHSASQPNGTFCHIREVSATKTTF